MPGTVILESWWFKPRDLAFVKASLQRCCAAVVVEIWCEVPGEVGYQRFRARNRHAVHQDARRLLRSWQGWIARAEPLDVGLTLRVRTDRPVDVGTIAAAVLGDDGRHII
jgi:predicted kinase